MMSFVAELESRTRARFLWSANLPKRRHGHIAHTDSPSFTFKDRQYSFRLSCAPDYSYTLALLDEKARVVRAPRPFNARVCCIAKESDEYFRETRAAADDEESIWKSHISDMHHLPGFDRTGYMRFRIVLASDSGDLRPTPKTENKAIGLSADLQKLMDEGFESDLVLRCGQQTIPVHRLILSARSKVFRAMLYSSDMKEKSSGSVDIQDIEFPVLQHFLRYLYAGTLPELTVQLATLLFEAGDKYDVKDLKEHCAKFLGENVTMQNAYELLVLADTHSDHELKKSVISYVLDQEIPKKDPEWSQFCRNHPRLGLEVLNQYMFTHECAAHQSVLSEDQELAGLTLEPSLLDGIVVL